MSLGADGGLAFFMYLSISPEAVVPEVSITTKVDVTIRTANATTTATWIARPNFGAKDPFISRTSSGYFQFKVHNPAITIDYIS
jgi:hypothetical protein